MKLVVLDRDGVINEDSDAFIKSPDEWQPIKGSLEAIARLNQADYQVVIASNQSGLARGLFSIETLNQIHDKMHRMLAEVGGQVDAVFFCPHGSGDGCHCRKPDTGLFEQIAERLGLSLQDVPVLGDSLRDLQAAQTVGAEPMLVLTGKGEKTQLLLKHNNLNSIKVYANLAAAVDAMLA